MSDPKIIIENEDSQRTVVNIGGLPSKINDVIPTGKKFDFKDDGSDSSVSLKSVTTRPKKQELDYGMYADPKKMSRKKVVETSEEESEEEYSESEESEGDSDGESDAKSEFSQAESEIVAEKRSGLSSFELKVQKKELLLKLHDAEQSGYQINGKYNMNSPLEELESEYALYERRMEQTAMVDFLQDGLMFIIKGLELGNGFYKPMGLNITGLSDKIYNRREQIEHVMKRLAAKYTSGSSLPPELSLLFIIGGAIVMTHISNTALSSGGIEKLIGGLTGGAGDSNPLQGIMSNLMKGLGQNKQPTQQPTQQPAQQPTMTPPKPFDISSLLSKMNDIKPTKPVDPFNSVGGKESPFSNIGVPSPNPFPKMTRDRDIGKPGTTATMPDISDSFSVTSDISSDDGQSTLNIAVPSRKKKGKKGYKNVFQV
jgi:hypothetical protein